MSTATPYSVHCTCGQQTPVERSAAGDVVTCVCGQRIKVPRLSELRRQAGQAAYDVSTYDRIRQMLAEGSLPPPPRLCALSQRPTSDVVYLTIACETPHRSGGYSWWWV